MPLARLAHTRAGATGIIPASVSHTAEVHRGEEAVQDDSRKTSQDGLDEYIRVSSPGLLVIIGALSLVLVATVVWGLTGRIPVTLEVTGCVVDPEVAALALGPKAEAAGGQESAWVVCYVDSSRYSADQIAGFEQGVSLAMPDRTSFRGSIAYVSPYPLSREEARLYLQDSQWVAERCASSDYSWGVLVRVDDDIAEHMYTTPQVTMTTEEVPPIRFLTR